MLTSDKQMQASLCQPAPDGEIEQQELQKQQHDRWVAFLEESWATPVEVQSTNTNSAARVYSLDAMYDLLRIAGCITGHPQHSDFGEFLLWRRSLEGCEVENPFEEVDLTPTLLTSSVRQHWQVLLVDGSHRDTASDEVMKRNAKGAKQMKRAKHRLKAVNARRA